MEFKSAYNFNRSEGSQSFSKNIDELGYFLDSSGNRVFGVVGEKNAYAEIQRDKDNTDWSIMKKYLFNSFVPGSAVPGVFGDRSSEPKDLIEAQEFLNNLTDKFKTLPVELQKKYNYSVLEFANGFSQEDLLLLNNHIKGSVSSDTVDKGDESEVK